MSEASMTLSTPASNAMVPASYAEKTMASLMQLHTELMDEKERRVDLYRRLMEKEQSLAELKMYVKLLEEKVSHAEVQTRPAAAPPPPAPSPAAMDNVTPLRAAREKPLPPPAPRRSAPAEQRPPHARAMGGAARVGASLPRPAPARDGWKTW